MLKVTLFTKNGGKAARVIIPGFNKKPDAITWGNRTFIRSGERYVEAFVVVASFTEPEEWYGE